VAARIRPLAVAAVAGCSPRRAVEEAAAEAVRCPRSAAVEAVGAVADPTSLLSPRLALSRG